MIWTYLEVFTKIRNGQKNLADDQYDKLNRSVTIILLSIAAIFIGSRSFGSTIVCLDDPLRTTPIGLDYVNSYCWINQLLYLGQIYDPKKFKPEEAEKFNFTSYAYLPMIVLLFSLLFYLPYLIWKRLVRDNNYQHIPVDISSVISLLQKSPTFKKEDFNKNIVQAAEYMDKCFTLNNYKDLCGDESSDNEFSTQNANGKVPKRYSDRRKSYGRFLNCLYFPLVLKYLSIKVLYLIVNLVVFYLADVLFQFRKNSHFYLYGIDMLHKYSSMNITTIDSYSERYFPLHVLCIVETQASLSGSQTRGVYHCSLPANAFNEKLIFVLWFWLVLMVFFNVLSILKWISKLIFRKGIIGNMLTWPYSEINVSEQALSTFVYEYLSGEGFLLIMLIKSNTQDWYSRSLVKELWKLYITNTQSHVIMTPPPNYSTGHILQHQSRGSYDDSDTATPRKTTGIQKTKDELVKLQVV
jgi:hypothetical protein